MKEFNFGLVQEGVKKILIGIGENPNREGLKKTPERVAKFWKEFLFPPECVPTAFSSSYDEMVILKDISIYSVCEHHLLPFWGKVSIGYIPNKGKVVGLSKIVRMMRTESGKLQIQERLTQDTGHKIEKLLKPKGVGVRIEACHMCMICRGVKDATHKTITTYVSGVFREKHITREEFLRNVI